MKADIITGRHRATQRPAITPDNPVKVLVVDDSPLMRRLLSELLESAPDIKVVGCAEDAFEAREKIKALAPDVITLDVEMPKMNGLNFLENLMRLRPMPVVMISTLTQKGADATMRAMELGAVSCVHKPEFDVAKTLAENAEDIVWEVRNAAAVAPELKRRRPQNIRAATIENKETSKAPAKISGSRSSFIVAIGASTGGTEAIKAVLTGIKPGGPGIVITQHIPPGFSASFANRMDDCTALHVSEATDGQEIKDGHCYIAPGDRHLEIERVVGAGFICRLHDGPRVSYHKPSVDVLFQSVAKHAGERSMGTILTGMGRDGADGLLAMRESGAMTFAQNEQTCVVYGMPRVAVEQNAAVKVLPLGSIASAIDNHSRARQKARR